MSSDSGKNLKGMVLSWPVVVVAAKEMEREFKRGIRKVEVHPAPRMRISASVGIDMSKEKDELLML